MGYPSKRGAVLGAGKGEGGGAHERPALTCIILKVSNARWGRAGDRTGVDRHWEVGVMGPELLLLPPGASDPDLQSHCHLSCCADGGCHDVVPRRS